MKIMYLLHIDWNWIKQRPQFIAERLAKNNDVICLSPHWYNRKNLQAIGNSDSEIDIKEFYGIPKAKKYIFVRKINNFLRSLHSLFCYLQNKPDAIYITHPELYRPWMKRIKAILLYDCMDDHISLTEDDRVKKLIACAEKDLVKDADIILASSDTIKGNLIRRYEIGKTITIVRNGYDGKIIQPTDSEKPQSKEINIGYIGTIAQWFDFDSILGAADEGIIFHIIGPKLNANNLPSHKKIIYEGIVEHKDLYEKIKDYNALIMPFKINDIVKSVDPVKLYEYINFNKPIISVYYPEIERFEPYVWFYGDKHETLIKAIEHSIIQGKKYSNSARTSILEESTWDQRARQIEQELQKLL